MGWMPLNMSGRSFESGTVKREAFRGYWYLLLLAEASCSELVNMCIYWDRRSDLRLMFMNLEKVYDKVASKVLRRC